MEVVIGSSRERERERVVDRLALAWPAGGSAVLLVRWNMPHGGKATAASRGGEKGGGNTFALASGLSGEALRKGAGAALQQLRVYPVGGDSV